MNERIIALTYEILSNFENNLDIAIANIEIKRDHINFRCINNNIDNSRQNLTLSLLSASGNIQAQAPISDLPRSDIVTFSIKRQLVPLNNWQDQYYFTSASPCLFPFGIKFHQKEQKRPMSLKAWVK